MAEGLAVAQGVLTQGKGEERIPVASLCKPRRLGQQGHSSNRWPLPGHVLNYRETQGLTQGIHTHHTWKSLLCL